MSARGSLLRAADPPARLEGGRPVVLVTLGAPVETAAASVALGAAVDAGSPLILANVTELEPLSLSLLLGYDALEELSPETSASLRTLTERAAALGLAVEWLRIRTPRPVRAMLELIRDRRPGLVVFGVGRGSVPRRRYRRAVAALKERGEFLIWLPEEAVAEAEWSRAAEPRSIACPRGRIGGSA